MFKGMRLTHDGFTEFYRNGVWYVIDFKSGHCKMCMVGHWFKFGRMF